MLISRQYSDSNSFLSYTSNQFTNKRYVGLKSTRDSYRQLTSSLGKEARQVIPSEFSRIEVCRKLLQSLRYSISNLFFHVPLRHDVNDNFPDSIDIKLWKCSFTNEEIIIYHYYSGKPESPLDMIWRVAKH